MPKCATCGVEPADLVAEHYQKTFELTLDLWGQRNKNFIILLVVSAITILLTYRTPGVLLVMTDTYNKLLGGGRDITTLTNGFPFELLQSILLAIILYLIIQIYHRTSHINQMYRYLEELENNIRERLALAEGTVTFTREGKFYSGYSDWLLKLTGLVYALILGVLLFLVGFGNKVLADARSNPKSAIDVILLIIIAIYYLKYLATTSRFKRLKVKWGEIVKSNSQSLVLEALLFGLIYGAVLTIVLHMVSGGAVSVRSGSLILKLLSVWVSLATALILWGLSIKKRVAIPPAAVK
jgi:hypothetical protein